MFSQRLYRGQVRRRGVSEVLLNDLEREIAGIKTFLVDDVAIGFGEIGVVELA